MALKIDSDVERFKDIVKGNVRKNLRKFISNGELIGKQGSDRVSIPVPEIRLPQFKFGDNRPGVGQGDGEVGDTISRGKQDGEGDGPKAGDKPGDHILEAEVSLEELAKMLGEELELPRIEPKGRELFSSKVRTYKGIKTVGPESLRHYKRTFKQALRRQISAGLYDPSKPRIIPVRDDFRYRTFKEDVKPEYNAAIIYIMDVSGSMSDDLKEIVRIESFWIDTWLRSQYKGIVSRYIVHDAIAKEVDRETFFRTKESGGTMISSAYKLCSSMIESDYNFLDWNIYPFHFSDGDNWSEDDNKLCEEILREKILPNVNVFCYGQVKSNHSPGSFLRYMDGTFKNDDRVITSQINSKEKIVDSIKDFLGKGK